MRWAASTPQKMETKYLTAQVHVSMVSDADESFFILSRDSDVDTKRRMNPDSPKSCLCFLVDFNFASDFFNLLLVTFHQAEIIRKYLIQGRSNETCVGVNHRLCNHGRSINDTPNQCNHYAMLSTMCMSSLLYSSQCMLPTTLVVLERVT